MLLSRWIETARRFANRPAIFDGATGELVTFAELNARLAALPKANGPVFARSGSLAFLLDVLRSWRDGQVLVPLERDTTAPELPTEIAPQVSLIKFTPGASGIPRGIFFTEAQLIADCERIIEAMGLTVAQPNLATISLAHSYGFSNIVLPLLLHGIPIHALPFPFPQAVSGALLAHDRLIVPAVPSMWRAWHRAGILQQEKIGFAISAGAPLSLELEHTIYDATGIKLHNFYGASECGGISLDTTETPRSDASDLGTPLPGVKVAIDSASKRLRVISDSVALGYDQVREGDELGHGIYLTRDLIEIDSSHRLHLRGTAGGAINVAGRKISPSRVEQALLASGLVKHAHVFGIASPDPERVQEISAEILLNEHRSLAELKAHPLPPLAPWERPRHWILGTRS